MVNDYLLISDYENALRATLPRKAFRGRELNIKWLKSASKKKQVSAICQWFAMRYCNPDNELPFCSQEGGYVWLDGGPYHAKDIITSNFEGIVSDEIIEKSISTIESSEIYMWSKIHNDEIDPLDIYEPIFSEDAALENLKENLRKIETAKKIKESIYQKFGICRCN